MQNSYFRDLRHENALRFASSAKLIYKYKSRKKNNMWESKKLKDILPLITKNLKKKDCLNMLWVCSYWRNILKPIISKRYYLEIKKDEKEQKEYSDLSWHTVYSYRSDIDLSLANINTLFLYNLLTELDFNLLPKTLKHLCVIVKSGETLEIKGEIPKLYDFCAKGDHFPYSLITESTKKVTYLPYCLDDNFQKRREVKDIDFKNFNVTSYKLFSISLLKQVRGDISLLFLSYNTLKYLTVNVDKLETPLTCFKALRKLIIKCDKIDVNYLPKSLVKLDITTQHVYNFKSVASFSDVKEYKIQIVNERKRIVRYVDKLYFPPNIIKCEISNSCSSESFKGFPKSVKYLECSESLISKFSKELQSLKNLRTLSVRCLDRNNESKYFKILNEKGLRHLYILGDLKIKPDTFPETMNVKKIRLFNTKVVDVNYLPKDLKVLVVSPKCEVLNSFLNSYNNLKIVIR